ncbi:hypothetical protein BKA70DRAFT_1239679 [Coprinopsis sp. MPI-PUGE-AT-0042]|nr:hypothetical protein BKA70DRAFT_1239679 [Coprinopsis sp. MPI-PUGE-AT-0042]
MTSINTKELVKWQATTMNKGETPLSDITDDATDYCILKGSGNDPSRYLLCRSKGEVANVTYAFYWDWGSHAQTGNYFPLGETIPDKISNPQQEPNWFCQTSYAFDVWPDPGFFQHIQTLNSLAANSKTFNKRNVPKKASKDASEDKTPTTFIMNSQIFTRLARMPRPEENYSFSVDYELHKHINKACYPRSQFIPKEERPSLGDRDPQTGLIESVEDLDREDYFQKGDLIWVCFRVVYTLRKNHWLMTLEPQELVRVVRVEEVEDGVPKAVEVKHRSSIGRHVGQGLSQSEESKNVLSGQKRGNDTDDEQSVSGHSAMEVEDETPRQPLDSRARLPLRKRPRNGRL